MLERNRMCDFLRFLCALLIMAFHLSLLGAEEGYPFSEAWIFVEFFFLLSGYYTARHFAGTPEIPPEAYARESVRYTLKKMQRTMWYAVPCILAAYVLEAFVIVADHGSPGEVLGLLTNLPFELLQLTAAGIGTPHDGTTWYISAIALLTPLLSYLLLRCRDFFTNILCWLLPIVCIGRWVTFGQSTSGIAALLRGFVWMSLGVLSFRFGALLQSVSFPRAKRALLTVLEVLCFTLCILLTYWNIRYYRTIYLAIFTGSTLMLSMCSDTAALRWKGFSFLGELSLPMFLSHWVVGRAIRCLAAVMSRFHTPFPMYIRVLLYYALTILFSTVMYVCVRQVHRKRKPADIPQKQPL